MHLRELIPVRFTLRTLFIGLTVLCCFLAYEVNWIQMRRAFIAEQETKTGYLNAPHDSDNDSAVLREIFSKVVYEIADFGQGRTKVPLFLGILGEKRVGGIVVVIPKEDVVVLEGRGYGITKKQHDYQRAKKLFPEAHVGPVVLSGWGGMSSVSVLE